MLDAVKVNQFWQAACTRKAELDLRNQLTASLRNPLSNK